MPRRACPYHTPMDVPALAADILAFWFGPAPHAARDAWFRKDAAFDAAIRARFGDAIEIAIAGGVRVVERDAARRARAHPAARPVHAQRRSAIRRAPSPATSARSSSPAAPSTRASTAELDSVRALVPATCRSSTPRSRAAQERSLALFGALAAETGDRDPLVWAEKHAVIVRRFGRYPHRNAILGRASTPRRSRSCANPARASERQRRRRPDDDARCPRSRSSSRCCSRSPSSPRSRGGVGPGAARDDRRRRRAVASCPGLERVHLDPDVFFLLFIPPLLYSPTAG